MRDVNKNLNQKRNQVTAELLKALTVAAGTQFGILKQTRDAQVVMGALLQHEAKRLEKKYGTTHSRLPKIDASLQRNTTLVKDLDVELEIATIRQPQVDKKAALVQGRVADPGGRGIADLLVYLGNGKGNPIRFVERAETQDNGYYALEISPEVLARLTEAYPEGAYLGVCTRRGEVVYQHEAVLKLKAGDRIQMENIVLHRRDLSPIGDGKPIQPPLGNTWTVRGQITNRAGEPLSGLKVSAIDNDHRFDDKLGTALTDATGNFTITYRRESAEAPGPDLYVTVINETGEELFSSQRELRQNASREEQFAITLAGATRPDVPLDGSVIWFETGSAKPRQGERLDINRLLKRATVRIQQFLRRNADGQVILHGYASAEEGSREAALRLSRNRGEALQSLLLRSGIPAGRTSVSAHGVSTTFSDVALNQRVEIVLSTDRRAPNPNR